MTYHAHHTHSLLLTYRSDMSMVSFDVGMNTALKADIAAKLGVSVDRDYDMNSLCVPRRGGEAAGAITTLTRENGESLTINVEYNQLDPMLR